MEEVDCLIDNGSENGRNYFVKFICYTGPQYSQYSARRAPLPSNSKSVTDERQLQKTFDISPFAISAPAEAVCRRMRMVVAKVDMLTLPLGETINMHTLWCHLSSVH